MSKPFFWQLYVTGHTFLFGVPFLFFPNQVLPWLGFPQTDEPWIRIAGILFLVTGATAYSVYRKHIHEMILPGIRVRMVIFMVLLYLAHQAHSLFILVMAVIILIGVVGSFLEYKQQITQIKSRTYG